MDDVDVVQLQEELFLQMAIDLHRGRRPQGDSALECEDCGEVIPEDRRRAAQGCSRCLRCQQQFERAAR